MPQKNMPKGWQPPYPSWSAEFAPEVREVIIGYFAVQSKDRIVGDFEEWMQWALSVDNAPMHCERAVYMDGQGYANQVCICYWTDRSGYDAWIASADAEGWWNDAKRLSGDAGYWREVIFAPMSRLETLFSSEDGAGMAALTDRFSEPVCEHAYWGSMRDRVPDSGNNDFQSEAGERLACRPAVDSRKRHVRIVPPENMCLIRSAQNWTECKDRELSIYQNSVHPALIEGMQYIRDNPIDSGCICCRFMDELGQNGERQSKTFGMAYFLTMGHLEAWAKSHPSHLAIFGNFQKMAQSLEFRLDLKLWHEVIVLPAGEHVFEYFNCHEKTGLLPYFSPA